MNGSSRGIKTLIKALSAKVGLRIFKVRGPSGAPSGRFEPDMPAETRERFFGESKAAVARTGLIP